MARHNFKRSSNRGGRNGGAYSGFKDATDLEEASHGVNRINTRSRIERSEERDIEKRRTERAKITLSSTLDAWLKKEVP